MSKLSIYYNDVPSVRLDVSILMLEEWISWTCYMTKTYQELDESWLMVSLVSLSVEKISR